MEKVKPGYKTTEFWMTIVTAVFSALVLLNVLSQEDAAEWAAIIGPVILAVAPMLAYVFSRAKVKSGA